MDATMDEAREVTVEENIFAEVLTLLHEANREDLPVDFNSRIVKAMKLLGQARVPEINNYHFNMGDSTNGAVGMCCSIVASGKEQAIRRLRDLLQKMTGDDYEVALEHPDLAADEYISIYITPENITHEYIDFKTLLE